MTPLLLFLSPLSLLPAQLSFLALPLSVLAPALDELLSPLSFLVHSLDELPASLSELVAPLDKLPAPLKFLPGRNGDGAGNNAVRTPSRDEPEAPGARGHASGANVGCHT